MIVRFGTAWIDPDEVAAVIEDTDLKVAVIMKSGFQLRVGEQDCGAVGQRIREVQTR